MALYKITRTDDWDYDEYDEVVVRAGSKEEALRVVLAGEDTTEHGYPTWHRDFHGITESNAAVEEIAADGEPAIIVASYNAG